MRIISGIYGRRRFSLPASFDARPTTDFAKESLFNVLANLTGWEGCEALDLFAGTGAISFELLSRGCRRVVAVENNRAHAAFIAKVAAELQTRGLELICGDAFRYLDSRRRRRFDFIFADPPYELKVLPGLPALILAKDWLNEGGIFVMEHPRGHDFSALPGFREERVYGSVHFSLFLKAGERKDA
jgi:16S rRNA (guanine(966)-N(2))-methyltransferase RsmD